MTRFEVVVSDPWDFKGPDGINSIQVESIGFISGPSVSKEEKHYLLLSVNPPLQYQEKTIMHMAAIPYIVGFSIEKIALRGGPVSIFRFLPDILPTRDRPFLISEVEYFLIGTLKPLKKFLR